MSTALFSYYLSLMDSVIQNNEQNIKNQLLKIIPESILGKIAIEKIIELFKEMYQEKGMENWKVAQLGTDIEPVTSYNLPNPGYVVSSLTVTLLEIFKIAPMIGFDELFVDFTQTKWGEILTGIYLDERGYSPFVGWEYLLNLNSDYDGVPGPRPDFFLVTKLMWVEAKSTDSSLYARINLNLKAAHKKIHDQLFFNPPVGGITCWAPERNTLYVAWIEVFASNPNPKNT